ncbi:MAG TPA: hypothetical protein VMG12_03360 [Polyangiaceae bacterium]|nr:hypothetical protein [Polyangiaceae bacterium]
MTFREAAREVSAAIRRPEQLALRYQHAEVRQLMPLILLLLANAFFGMAAYGLTMQLHDGTASMLRAGAVAPLAAGLAWTIALPALYILNGAAGSRLRLGATLLAASVTVCFGSWAMLASVPINWFFTLAAPWSLARLATNLVVFSGVGVCMTDVFVRVLGALEPERSRLYGMAWVGLVSVIGMELFSIGGIFEF